MKSLRFGIIGTYQTGKSLLVNCLLGRYVSSVGKGNGTTHSIVNYYYSPMECIVVVDSKGNQKKLSIDKLHLYDTDDSVTQIDVYLDCEFLKSFILTDTPGVGYMKSDNEKAIDAIKNLDYAIVILPNNKELSYADPLYQNISVLNSYNIPFFWFMNCVDVTKSEKWDTDSEINHVLYRRNADLLAPFHPIDFAFLDQSRIVNLIWYWYSICPDFEHDIILQPYCQYIEGDGLTGASKLEVKAASNFSLIQSIFDIDNRTYLELKKEIQYEVAKLRTELCPIGTIQSFAFAEHHGGWLPCDGRMLSRSEFPELFNVIGFTFGGDNKDIFKIPDLRGRFVRGWDNEGSLDGNRIFGSSQEDTMQNHQHKTQKCSTFESGEHHHAIRYRSYTSPGEWGPSTNVWEVSGSSDRNVSDGSLDAGKHTHSVPELSTKEIISSDSASVVRISDETRPKNIALLYCIKVSNNTILVSNNSVISTKGNNLSNVKSTKRESTKKKDEHKSPQSHSHTVLEDSELELKNILGRINYEF